MPCCYASNVSWLVWAQVRAAHKWVLRSREDNEQHHQQRRGNPARHTQAARQGYVPGTWTTTITHLALINMLIYIYVRQEATAAAAKPRPHQRAVLDPRKRDFCRRVFERGFGPGERCWVGLGSARWSTSHEYAKYVACLCVMLMWEIVILIRLLSYWKRFCAVFSHLFVWWTSLI